MTMPTVCEALLSRILMPDALTNVCAALVAGYFGIRTRRVRIGYGPTLFTWAGQNWNLEFGALLAGGYTQFVGSEEAANDKNEALFQVDSSQKLIAPELIKEMHTLETDQQIKSHYTSGWGICNSRPPIRNSSCSATKAPGMKWTACGPSTPMAPA